MTNDEWIQFSEIEDLDNIEFYEKRYQEGVLCFETLSEEITFLYNLGLFYTEYYQTQDQIKQIFRIEDKYYLSIYYYLKGIKLYEDNKEKLQEDFYFVNVIIRRLYVNIAIQFSNQFRSISALSFFRRALEIDNSFDMAIGNFALGIEHHTPLVGLEIEKYDLVFNKLLDLYMQIEIENLDSGHDFFMYKQNQYASIQNSYLHTNILDKNFNYNPYCSFKEIVESVDSYENWCVFNTLYLNYINDIGNYNESKFDIDLQKLNKDLCLSDAQLHSLNNLFQLFVYQRKKLYNCRNLECDETLLELAQIFQTMYSFFDKVSFFIYKFFELSGNEKSVNIHRIWKMENAQGINLLEYKNQHLFNIFWLRKEYRENSKDRLKINELFSPDAQDYAEIRNILEHKEFSFKIIEGLPYLDPTLLFKKTMRLANIARDMILSLIQMVITERKLVDPSTHKRDLDLIFLSYEGFK